jgi:hypothetical protein
MLTNSYTLLDFCEIEDHGKYCIIDFAIAVCVGCLDLLINLLIR